MKTSISNPGRQASRLTRGIGVSPVPAAAAFLAIILTSCGQKPTANSTPPLATVGNQSITAADLLREASRRQAANQTVPDKAELLRQMTDRLALLEKARAAKLDMDTETVRAMESILIGKLKETTLETKLNQIDISEEELQKAHQEQSAKFTVKPKARLAMLFMENPPQASEAKTAETRKRMDDALQRWQAAPKPEGRGPAAQGFGSFAAECSEDQVSRYRGGDLGWMDVGDFSGRLPKPVLEAAYALEVGKTSPVIAASNGLYVVMKTDFRETQATPYAEARPALRQAILADKRRQLEATFLAEANAAAKTSVNAEILAGVSLPLAQPSSSQTQTTPPALPGMPVTQ